MKLIFGTKNKAKLNHLNKVFELLPYRLEGLDETIEDCEENSSDIKIIAREKALYYYKQLGQPVFSCDSGLYFDEVSDEEQPGAAIRRVAGKRLTDQEMIDYYGQLAKKYGGKITGRYRNAICLVLDEDHIYSYEGDDIASDPFYLVSTPHAKKREGFPLDSLSVEIKSGRYYYDMSDYHVEESKMNEGFVQFFKRVIQRPKVRLQFKGYQAIILELYPEYAPQTVCNFIELIQKGYYNDKSLCRVVPGRLIQSGDTTLPPEAWTDDTPGYILKGEFNREGYHNPLSFTKGTMGMAMASYEWTPYATAGSFFIMNKDEASLDGVVPAFARVIDGMDSVEALNRLETHNRFGYDAPDQVVPIESITVETYGMQYGSPEKIYKTFT